MSDPGFDVIVCGSLHLDIVVRAPALPRIDETAVGRSWAQVCGGKGGNQAVQAARQGARTAMIGRVGADDFGRRLTSNLQSASVDVRAVAVDETSGSGMSVAVLQDDGDYGAVIVSGSNLAIDPASIGPTWASLGGGRVLLLQNEVPEAVNLAAAATARAQGGIVVLNAAPARPIGPDLLDRVDVLVVNRVEAEALSGRRVASRADALAALPALGGEPRAVVVTLGADGLVVSPGRGAPVEIAPVPVEVVSTHGAGDCFLGTLAALLAKGMELVEACRGANERAAAFVAGR